jgi:hypothetical protein
LCRLRFENNPELSLGNEQHRYRYQYRYRYRNAQIDMMTKCQDLAQKKKPPFLVDAASLAAAIPQQSGPGAREFVTRRDAVQKLSPTKDGPHTFVASGCA